MDAYFNFDTLLNRTYEDATELAKQHGYRIRVIKKDGQSFACTCDYITTRINVHIENNRISHVDGLG